MLGDKIQSKLQTKQLFSDFDLSTLPFAVFRARLVCAAVSPEGGNRDPPTGIQLPGWSDG